MFAGAVRYCNHPSSSIGSCGFTLIELLVVISIVMALMAVLLPVLGRVRKQAANHVDGASASLRVIG